MLRATSVGRYSGLYTLGCRWLLPIIAEMVSRKRYPSKFQGSHCFFEKNRSPTLQEKDLRKRRRMWKIYKMFLYYGRPPDSIYWKVWPIIKSPSFPGKNNHGFKSSGSSI